MLLRVLIEVALLTCAGCLRTEAQFFDTFTFSNLDRTIPDGCSVGTADTRSITSAVSRITALRVRLHIEGEFDGDLYSYLRHENGAQTQFCVLLNRIGKTDLLRLGSSAPGLDVSIEDSANAGNIHFAVGNDPSQELSAILGSWQPDGRDDSPETVSNTSPINSRLEAFQGADANGYWTLYLADLDGGGTNRLLSWTLEIEGIASPRLSIAYDANTACEILIEGAPAVRYQLECCDSLPDGVWQPLAATLADASGRAFYLDTNSVVTPCRYYRCSVP
jgi:hypothetical protein